MSGSLSRPGNQGFEKLEIWRDGVDLACRVYEALRGNCSVPLFRSRPTLRKSEVGGRSRGRVIGQALKELEILGLCSTHFAERRRKFQTLPPAPTPDSRLPTPPTETPDS